jgi:hypothetical protein
MAKDGTTFYVVQEFKHGRWHGVETTRDKAKADALLKAGGKRRVEIVVKRAKKK